MSLANVFHPQDLLALGLALVALACVRRGWWVWAGVFVGLAVLTHQFALLVALPLFVIAPAARRWSFAGAATATVALATFTVFATATAYATKTVTVGSGAGPGPGGTWLTNLGLDTHLAEYASRIVPLELSLVLAWFVARRLGDAVFEPVPLASLMALSLSLRLVFEQNLFGYYFAALAVMLVLLDVAGGRIRAALMAWLIAVSVVFFVGETTALEAWKYSWPISAHIVVPIVVAIILATVGLHALGKGPRREDLIWIALAVGLTLAWPWRFDPVSAHVTRVWWQVGLVTVGIWLAVGPLLRVSTELARAGPERVHEAGAGPQPPEHVVTSADLSPG
jgi:hypothetical protein